jgi:hypothetical protein
VAPESDWYNYFAPAWQEYVLDAKPTIPFFHVTDLRDPEWLKEYGVTWDQAQDKLDAATIVIDQMGSLYPLAVNANAGVFLDAHGKKKIMESGRGGKAARYLIDHFCFKTYVFTVLHYIHLKHPDAEKVDFVVERKEGVFEKIEQFYDSFESGLKHIRRPELIKYMGQLNAVGKEHILAQAADMLCWHASRHDLDLLKGRDAMRANTMFKRKGNIIPLPDEVHFDIARSFANRIKKLEETNDNKPRVRKLRPNNAATDERATQRDKGRPRRRKKEKGAKEKAES